MGLANTTANRINDKIETAAVVMKFFCLSCTQGYISQEVAFDSMNIDSNPKRLIRAKTKNHVIKELEFMVAHTRGLLSPAFGAPVGPGQHTLVAPIKCVQMSWPYSWDVRVVSLK